MSSFEKWLIGGVGLLAVVAACANGSVVPEVERYLATWHRERPARCRWMPDRRRDRPPRSSIG